MLPERAFSPRLGRGFGGGGLTLEGGSSGGGGGPTTTTSYLSRFFETGFLEKFIPAKLLKDF
jgi:hypothetical protein